MDYIIKIEGKEFKGSLHQLLTTAVNSLKDYIVPTFRELSDESKKFTENWKVARRFLREYFELLLFLKDNLGKKSHEAIPELLKASDLEGTELMEFLEKSKIQAVRSISRQIKGKMDGSDALERFLEEDLEEDDDY